MRNKLYCINVLYYLGFLNLPAVRSQETFPRFSVLTNEQCEYTQYSVI